MGTKKQPDLIDRSALGIGRSNPDVFPFDNRPYCAGWNGVVNLIEEAPAVDAVVLPCKIGDTVWAIRSFHGKKHPQKGIVSEMLFLKNMELQIVVKYVARGPWGKTVFATKEEAENAIGGNQN